MTHTTHITVAEAAQRLGVSVRTIRRACAAGVIRCERLGVRTWMIATEILPSTIRQRAPKRRLFSVDSEPESETPGNQS